MLSKLSIRMFRRTLKSQAKCSTIARLSSYVSVHILYVLYYILIFPPNRLCFKQNMYAIIYAKKVVTS